MMLLVLSGEVLVPGDLGRLAGGIRTRARSGICSRPRQLSDSPHHEESSATSSSGN